MTLVHIPARSVEKDDVAVNDEGQRLWKAVENAVTEHGFARFAIARVDPGPLTILTVSADAVLTVERKPRLIPRR